MATTSSPYPTSSAGTPSCRCFCAGTLLPGRAALPAAQRTDIYLTALAILLTLVYAAGLLFRPNRRIAGMGVDSFVVLVLYALGVAGLFAIAHH